MFSVSISFDRKLANTQLASFRDTLIIKLFSLLFVFTIHFYYLLYEYVTFYDAHWYLLPTNLHHSYSQQIISTLNSLITSQFKTDFLLAVHKQNHQNWKSVKIRPEGTLERRTAFWFDSCYYAAVENVSNDTVFWQERYSYLGIHSNVAVTSDGCVQFLQLVYYAPHDTIETSFEIQEIMKCVVLLLCATKYSDRSSAVTNVGKRGRTIQFQLPLEEKFQDPQQLVAIQKNHLTSFFKIEEIFQSIFQKMEAIHNAGPLA